MQIELTVEFSEAEQGILNGIVPTLGITFPEYGDSSLSGRESGQFIALMLLATPGRRHDRWTVLYGLLALEKHQAQCIVTSQVNHWRYGTYGQSIIPALEKAYPDHAQRADMFERLCLEQASKRTDLVFKVNEAFNLVREAMEMFPGGLDAIVDEVNQRPSTRPEA